MIVICFLLSAACKKKKFNNETTEEPKIEEPLKKVYLPTRFESKNLTITLKYQDQTTLLSSLESSAGKRAEITYKNGLLLKVAFYTNDKVTGFVDFQSSNNRTSAANLWEEIGRLNLQIDHHKFSYDLQDRLVEIHFYGPDYVLFKHLSLTYSDTGNIASIISEYIANNISDGLMYQYDNKNGIFKEVKFFQILFRELGYDFFHPGANNPLRAEVAKSKSEYATYSYLYNDRGYPSELNIDKGSLKESYKISYKEIQL